MREFGIGYVLSRQTEIKASKSLAHKRILVGPSALEKLGLVCADFTKHAVLTPRQELDRCTGLYLKYIYSEFAEDFNYTQGSKPLMDNLVVPTPERALVEFVQHLDKLDGDFCMIGFVYYLSDALKDNYDKRLSKLYEVADYFGVPGSKIDSIIKEARTFRIA